MLEYPILLVHAWAQTPQPAGKPAWTRVITDSAGQSLGFARLGGDRWGTWFSWLRRQRIEVFETQDESFLMSLTRSWGIVRSWELEDAEDGRVGGIYTKTIVTSENQWIGFVDRQAGGCGRILDANNRPLASFSGRGASVVELTFAAETLANPFLRMLLLGAALTLDAIPRDG